MEVVVGSHSEPGSPREDGEWSTRRRWARGGRIERLPEDEEERAGSGERRDEGPRRRSANGEGGGLTPARRI